MITIILVFIYFLINAYMVGRLWEDFKGARWLILGITLPFGTLILVFAGIWAAYDWINDQIQVNFWVLWVFKRSTFICDQKKLKELNRISKTKDKMFRKCTAKVNALNNYNPEGE